MRTAFIRPPSSLDRSADRGDDCGGLVDAAARAASGNRVHAPGRRRVRSAETGRPALAVWPCRCALHGGRVRRPGMSVLPGLLPRAQALDRRPSRGELAVAPPAAVHARAGRDCRGAPGRVRGRDRRTCRVLAGRGVALRAHPRRRPGPAGGPALSRPHASHAAVSRQRAPRRASSVPRRRKRHSRASRPRRPCDCATASPARPSCCTVPSKAMPCCRPSTCWPPAARPRRTRPFPRHARRRCRRHAQVAIDLQGYGAARPR